MPPAHTPGVAPGALPLLHFPGSDCVGGTRAEEPEEKGLGGEGVWGACPPRGVRQPPGSAKGPARSGRRHAFSSPGLGGTTYTCWRSAALDAVNLGALKQTDKHVERTPGR